MWQLFCMDMGNMDDVGGGSWWKNKNSYDIIYVSTN